MTDFIELHIRKMIEAAVEENEGNYDDAERLRAQGNLRLVIMSADELEELAYELAGDLPASARFNQFVNCVYQLKRSAKSWIPEICRKPDVQINSN